MNIGVFFGSRSPEHDVSIITGQLIISGLKGLGHTVTPVYLSKKGEWLLGEELGRLGVFTDPIRKIETEKFAQYHLDLENSRGKLVFRKKGALGKEITVDLAFPAFHGSYGEDGTIQGLFEMFGVPYVGCGVAASAVSMDKVLTKQLFEANDIPTTKFLFFSRGQWQADKEDILNQIKSGLRWPVFIKPAHLGSSIGIAKVKDEKALENAVDVALHYDDKFLAEESVENLADITCAVLGNDEPQASLLQESAFTDELFTYDEKYLKEGGAQLGKAQSSIHIPARLPAAVTEEIRQLAVRIFRVLGCAGTARVDFLYDKSANKYYAIEINPLPGTLYHHLWEKSGLTLPQLLEKLITLAQEKDKAKKSTAFTFESDLLKKTGSLKLKKDV